MNRMPTLFVSHGAPNVVLYDVPARRFFDTLAEHLPRPSAIVVASAHYDADTPAVTGGDEPTTIHDFYGFEPALYAMNYPAPGAPALAARVVDLIQAALGVEAVVDDTWGFDHGAWSPLSRIYPAADIPMLELSVNARADPAYHLRLGRALQALRAEGVLVIGSGSIVHNLARIAPPMENEDAPGWALDFLAWLHQHLSAADEAALIDYRARAPYALESHPTADHLLPMYVAMGAAGEGWRATRLHHSVTFGTVAMDCYRFD